MSISRQLLFALKTSDIPMYRWAQEAGFKRPEDFSRILHGARPIRDRHLPGLEKIGQALGVKRVVVKDSDGRRARRVHDKAARVAAHARSRSTQSIESGVTSHGPEGSRPA